MAEARNIVLYIIRAFGESGCTKTEINDTITHYKVLRTHEGIYPQLEYVLQRLYNSRKIYRKGDKYFENK